MSAPTLITPYGYSSSSCGYCSPQGRRSSGPSSKKYGLTASQMSVTFYQKIIDRGWRRSGDFVYHPDMERTCCPQYTIRLSGTKFKPNKKHRQVINRFNRYLKTGLKPGEEEGKGKGKEKAGERFQFPEALVGCEGKELAHLYETVLVSAKPSAETYDLYKRYQISVHGDTPDKVTMRGFTRFLCASPLLERPLKYTSSSIETSHLPRNYGSYHLLYKVDGKIIGISVIDILPSCVSSVYFIWDPDWAWASLGKLSALREIALTLEMKSHGAEGMEWVYMGYWIPDCVKMKYKSEYEPSYLLDPGTREFHLLTSKMEVFLQAHPRGYIPFDDVDDLILSIPKPPPAPLISKASEDEDEDDVEEMDEWPKTPPPGFSDPDSFTQEQVDNLLVFRKPMGLRKRPQLVRVEDLQFVDPEGMDGSLRELMAAVGVDMLAGADGEADTIKDTGILYFG